jgi:Na+-translocating ferredoxin:NAD+ oxidoreductase subunit D
VSTANPSLSIAAPPHRHGGKAIPRLMLHSVIALLPATAFAVVAFGLAALASILVAILACLLAERFCARPSSLDDGSALLTGLLLGLSLPPALPLWMVALGGVIAMLVGRQLFGGLGGYAFQPVLVGRIVLQAAFPAAMAQSLLPPFEAGRLAALPASSLALPLLKPDSIDAFSGATPLAAARTDAEPTAWIDLLLGNVAGASGETSALLLMLGGLYLVAMRVVDWRIPVALLTAVALCSALLHGIDPARHPGTASALFSGGLMLGAWFLATDPVGSPLSRRGKWVFGLSIGLLVVLIRQFSGHPEGILYAILLGNALTPHIDRWTQPRPLGLRGQR